MIFKLFKYHFLKTIRDKGAMFWSLAFPLILGTLFYVSFGNFMDKAEMFKDIPVAYVEENGEDKYFKKFLETLEKEKNPLISLKKISKSKAQKLLVEKEISGIYYNNSDLSLVIAEEGINQSILKTILDEYQVKKNSFKNIAMKYPEKVADIQIDNKVNFIKEKKLTDGNMDMMTNYFYSLIAMTCLYGSFLGVTIAIQFKGNLSTLAVRRIMGGTNRFVLLITDILVNVFIQFSCSIIAICYLKFILKINLGSQFAFILLTSLVGCIIGITTGFFIGSIGKGKENVKVAISLAVSMVECFLSGLMINTIYSTIEKNIPIVNRINPAALIVDSFYSLNIYEGYERFTKNMLTLLIITVILIVISILSIRREKYASL